MDLGRVPGTLSIIIDASYSVFGAYLGIQDQRYASVSLRSLFISYFIWILLHLLPFQFTRLLGASLVLLLGVVLLLIFPDRLGEADVVFMSGMALFFPFWSLMMAYALGCLGAMAAFAWLSYRGRIDLLRYRMPLIPCLYWGGLAVLLGGIAV